MKAATRKHINIITSAPHFHCEILKHLFFSWNFVDVTSGALHVLQWTNRCSLHTSTNLAMRVNNTKMNLYLGRTFTTVIVITMCHFDQASFITWLTVKGRNTHKCWKWMLCHTRLITKATVTSPHSPIFSAASYFWENYYMNLTPYISSSFSMKWKQCIQARN